MLPFLLVLLGAGSAASAQECVGLPAGRGLLSVGFEGTDGAAGRGLSFAYRTPGAAVVLQRRSLDGFTLVDELRTSEARVSVKLPGVRLPVCLVAGTSWTAYDNDRHESTQWSGSDPRYRTERHRLGGPYQRLRVPVGVGVGHEFRLGGGVSLVPYLQPALVLEHESYTPEDGPKRTRRALGLGGSAGVAAALGWFVVRTSVTHTATHEYALSSQHNWPELSAHVGVRF